MLKPRVKRFRKYYHIDVSEFKEYDNKIFTDRIIREIEGARYNDRGCYLEVPNDPPQLIEKAKLIMRDVYGIDNDGKKKQLTDSLRTDSIPSYNNTVNNTALQNAPGSASEVFIKSCNTYQPDMTESFLTDIYFREEVIRQKDYCIKYLGLSKYINLLKKKPGKNDKITYNKIVYRLITPPVIMKTGDMHIYTATAERLTGRSEYTPGSNPGDLFEMKWKICEGELPFCPFEIIRWNNPDDIIYLDAL